MNSVGLASKSEMEGLLVEKEIFTKEEFLEMVRVVDREMERKESFFKKQ